MGFANWNLFGCDYNDTTFRQMSDAMVNTGLAALGFKYMLVQECIVPVSAPVIVMPFHAAPFQAFIHALPRPRPLSSLESLRALLCVLIIRIARRNLP